MNDFACCQKTTYLHEQRIAKAKRTLEIFAESVVKETSFLSDSIINCMVKHSSYLVLCIFLSFSSFIRNSVACPEGSMMRG